MPTVNLGQIAAIHIGTTPPTNLKMLWYDDNVGQKIPKFYDISTSSWKAFPAITPGVANQVAVYDSLTGINSSAGFTFDGATLNVDGDVVITGDLTVQGTTTTIDTEILQVKDKNIELGKVDTPTDITADGGGITLLGDTNKIIEWHNADNRWHFNQGADITGGLYVVGNPSAPDDEFNAQVGNVKILAQAGLGSSGTFDMDAVSFTMDALSGINITSAGNTVIDAQSQLFINNNGTLKGTINSGLIKWEQGISNVYIANGVVDVKTNTSGLTVNDGNTQLGVTDLYVQINTSGFFINDDLFNKGAVYGADYSPNFVDRSLVDKGFVDVEILTAKVKEDGGAWTPTSDSLTNEGWFDVTQVGTDFNIILATTQSGYIYKSIDRGKSWTSVLNTGGQAVKAIVSNADGSAVVASSTNGNLFRSTDQGDNWTAIPVPTHPGGGASNYADCGTYGDKFVFAVTGGSVDQPNDGLNLYSLDEGLTWNWGNLGGTSAISSFTPSEMKYDSVNDIYHSISNNSGLYSQSADGITWNVQTQSGPNEGDHALYVNGNIVLIIGQGGSWTRSNDGGSTFPDSGSHSFQGGPFRLSNIDGDILLFMSGANSGHYVQRSTDNGTTFTPEPNSVDMGYQQVWSDDTNLVAVGNGAPYVVTKDSAPILWTDYLTQQIDVNASNIAAEEAARIAADAVLQSNIDNLDNLSAVQSGTGDEYIKIAANGDLSKGPISAGYDSSATEVSEEITISDPSEYFQGLKAGGGVWIGVTQYQGVYRSTDGLNWSRVRIVSNERFGDVTYLGDDKWALSGWDGITVDQMIIESSDGGLTWVRQSIDLSGQYYGHRIHSLTNYNSWLYAGNSGGVPGSILKHQTGVSTTEIDLVPLLTHVTGTTSINTIQVTGTGTLIVSYRDNLDIYTAYSTDEGVSWTEVFIGTFPTGSNIDLKETNGKVFLFAYANATGNQLWETEDGITWNDVSIPTVDAYIYDIDYNAGEGKYYITTYIGAAPKRVYTTTDLATYANFDLTYISNNSYGQVAVGNSGIVFFAQSEVRGFEFVPFAGLSLNDWVDSVNEYINTPHDLSRVLGVGNTTDGNNIEVTAGDEITIKGATVDYGIKTIGDDFHLTTTSSGLSVIDIDGDGVTLRTSDGETALLVRDAGISVYSPSTGTTEFYAGDGLLGVRNNAGNLTLSSAEKYVRIHDGTLYGEFNVDAVASTNKTWTMPNKNGTVAMLDDLIPKPTLSRTLTLDAPAVGDNITIFRTDVAITVQEVLAVSTGTTPSTTYQLRHATSRNDATPNDLTTSGTTTSVAQGNGATLSDATIPANSWVWLEATAASGTDVILSVDIRYTED